VIPGAKGRQWPATQAAKATARGNKTTTVRPSWGGEREAYYRLGGGEVIVVDSNRFLKAISLSRAGRNFAMTRISILLRMLVGCRPYSAFCLNGNTADSRHQGVRPCIQLWSDCFRNGTPPPPKSSSLSCVWTEGSQKGVGQENRGQKYACLAPGHALSNRPGWPQRRFEFEALAFRICL
jgi:hypothetical protein